MMSANCFKAKLIIIALFSFVLFGCEGSDKNNLSHDLLLVIKNKRIPIWGLTVKFKLLGEEKIYQKKTDSNGFVMFFNLTKFPESIELIGGCIDEKIKLSESAHLFKFHYETIEINAYDTSIRFINTSRNHIEVWKSEVDGNHTMQTKLLGLPSFESSWGDNYESSERRYYLKPGKYNFMVRQASNCLSNALFFNKCNYKNIVVKIEECENLDLSIDLKNDDIIINQKVKEKR